jgi:hypothetical protein
MRPYGLLNDPSLAMEAAILVDSTDESAGSAISTHRPATALPISSKINMSGHAFNIAARMI